ncbi:ATP-dependent Clp protease ATP-binding subunit [Candidatus Saccharibacteria bacterium]|nr:ATP-dependent Clp protease ATP-binding subunit [Candidatus Saccharibacteria bacterium]
MNQFRYYSLRASEARFGRFFDNKAIRFLIWFVTIALYGLAIFVLWYLHNSLGWLLCSLAIVLTMLMIWANGELLHPAIGKSDNITDVLSRDILVLLNRKPTSRKLAEIVCKTQSGGFLAMRYAITPTLLELCVADLSEDIEPIFAKAREIQQITNSEQIAGAILSVAILECNPKCETILKRMRLTIDDLYGGIIWYNYLHGLVKNMRKPRHTGGFARDLMFGYTPTLQETAVNISRMREGVIKEQVHLAAHDEIIEQMIQIFSNTGRQNVALIGPEGSGRATIVTAFADKILESESKISSQLKYRQIFKLDAAALIGMAGKRGRVETLVRDVLTEGYMAKNVIIWLENAQLFFEDGEGSVDIANTLLPILEGGKLRIILTMDEQRYLEISARNSALANALNKIMVHEANEEETMRIMQDHVPEFEYDHNVIYTIWALKEAYRLSERYVHDLVMPGRALNLLEAAANHAGEDKFVTEESVQAAIEKTYGVKMQSTQTNEDKERLLHMEELIHERMIDQEGAVKAVSDALRRSAAGVRNEHRPIGTFLFMGPTGVGKTELAKALSDVYFNGEGTMIRIDLNEFVSPDDVERLIEDGAVNELSLTSQVMKHPFAVVLLDEIEKAHPQVLTTLLQLLDEGILRDVRNREVSFRDTIVICTSNAGANRIREYIDSGKDLAEVKEELTNELIHQGDFKPEFLNRFDEICVFKPLSKEDLRSIVDLIINGVNKTLENKKMNVVLNDEAKDLLVERGYDPKLGARPMRRIVQQTVENIVAKAVLSGEMNDGDSIMINAAMIKESLD